MTTAAPPDLKFEIGHVLFIDIVGYSKLLINEQTNQLQKLKELVRATEQVRMAEMEGKLLRLPTGDGGALVFRTTPEAPVLCALQIATELRKHPQLQVRMGIHSGPVNTVTDLNENANIAGAGINIAQRVMDCGDAGHILLSKHVADDLEHYPHWQSHLHSLGECEVKHGLRIGVVNLHRDEVGNPKMPKKLLAVQQRRRRMRWATIVTVLLLLTAIAAAFVIASKKSILSTSAASEKSVAVLPLENLSDEKENAFFADGIQDELLSNLAKIRDLKVISRTSVMQYKTGITRNLKEIAQQLSVTNVVEGSVRRSGNHVRVSVQLIDALSDRHIWVQNYDRTVADSLALEGELATEIAAGVGATLSPQEKVRVKTGPTQNATAYDAYLRGRAAAAGSLYDLNSLEGAVTSFKEAVKLDPKFTLAWAYLSRAQSAIYWNGLDPTRARLAAAKDALDHAVALDRSLPETHLALGFYRYYGERDFRSALQEFLIAEKSLPNDVDVLGSIGLIQRRLGHWDEAIAAQRRVVELDPLNVGSARMLGTSYMAVRRFSDMASIADHILAIDPASQNGVGLKVYSLWATAEFAKADALLQKPGVDVDLLVENAMHKRQFSDALVLLSKAPPSGSDKGEAERLLDAGLAQERMGNSAAAKAAYGEAAQKFIRLLKEAAPDSAPAAELHSNLGMAYAGLGDAASANAEGEKGVALQPTSEDPFDGPGRESAMARIYATLGDANHAMPIVERLAKMPGLSQVVPWHLRLDPTWDPIRNDPRFQKLVNEPQSK